MGGRAWTPDETSTLIQLRARNASWRDIKKATGHSIMACKSKLAHPSRLPQEARAEMHRLRDVIRPRWTSETEAELLRLRDVEKLAWITIDGHFGRTHGSCAQKYKSIKQGAITAKHVPYKPAAMKPIWTETEMKLAETRWRELFVDVWGVSAPRHERALVFAAIGREMKRTGSAVENRLRMFGASFGMNLHSKPLPEPVQLSQAMIDARERYAARLRQDPCSLLMGDPPPGFSALDERRQACTGAPRDQQ